MPRPEAPQSGEGCAQSGITIHQGRGFSHAIGRANRYPPPRVKQDTVQGRRSRSRGGDGDGGGRRRTPRSRPAKGLRTASSKEESWRDPEAKDPTARLPAYIALFSLLIALWIFTRNTVPALEERNELRHAEQHLLRELARTRERIASSEARLHAPGPHSPTDPQALMVAIDAMGLTPAELLMRYPEDAEQSGESPASGDD